MKRILIAKDVAYSAKIGGSTISGVDEINLLATGAIAFFTEDNRMLTAANANTVFTTLPDTKAIYIAVGSGSAVTGAKVSGLIDRFTTSVQVQPYVAPVVEVQFIGGDGNGTGLLNLPSPLVVGSVASIRLTNIASGTMPPENQWHYEYVVKTGDTIALVVTGIVAAINANTSSPVVAVAMTGTNAGVKLTTKAAYSRIEVGYSGILSAANLLRNGDGDSVAIVYGKGTPTQVAALEFECNPVEGDTNRVYMPHLWFTKTTDVDTAVNYTLVNIKWQQTLARPTGSVIPSNQIVVVALPPTGTLAYNFSAGTGLAAIFAEAFGVNRINVETGK